jgi:Zn-dependent peptidase ImmA (M78 family)/predicted secreted protein
MSGAYVFNSEGQSGMVINSKEPPPRQRFTAAHELGHHVFNHGTTVDAPQAPHASRSRAMRSDHEKLAEAFAEWFLMPRPLIRAALGQIRHGRRLTAAEVYNLSLRVGASYDATVRHLENLRMASQREVEGWLAVPPKRIKQALARGPALSDWHRDVWEVTEKDRGATLWVNAGDRVVVSLEETPTSGYLWEWRANSHVHGASDGYTGEEEKAKGDLLEEAALVVGGPAIHWFALDVGEPGSREQLRLDFAKRRPWQPDDSPDSFDLRVNVEHQRLGVREDLLAFAGQ